MTLTTGNQLKAARALAGVDQQQVADSAGVNVNTIRNMEARGVEPITSSAVTVHNVQVALEALGIEFLNHARPGVRLSIRSERAAEIGDAQSREPPRKQPAAKRRKRPRRNDSAALEHGLGGRRLFNVFDGGSTVDKTNPFFPAGIVFIDENGEGPGVRLRSGRPRSPVASRARDRGVGAWSKGPWV